MAKPWSEVENSKAFLSLDPSSREAAKKEYFDSVVAVKPEFAKLPDPEKEMARSEFFGISALPQDVQKPEQNIGQKVWGALDAYGKAGISNAVGMANGVTAGLARPAIKAVTGQDIGEGSFIGKMTGAVVPAGLAGKGIGMVAKAANPLVRGALKLGGEGAVAALANTPEEDFQKYLLKAPEKIVGGAAGNIAFGGALQGAGKLYNMIPEGAKSFAAREINSLIRPGKNLFSYSKNPGRGIVEEGIVGNSLEDVLTKTDAAKQKIWSEVSQKVQGSNTRIDLSNTATFFDDAITKASKTPKMNKEVINRLKDAKSDLLRLGHLKSMTPEEVMSFKQTVGELTKFTGNPSDDKLVNEALKKVFGNAKGKLETAVSGISDLTERYADLISAGVAIKNRMAGSQSQPIMGWIPRLALTAGGAIAGTAGGGPVGTLAGVGAAVALEKLAGSTAAKTRFAQFLSKNVSKAKIKPSTIGKVSSSAVGGLSGLINSSSSSQGQPKR